MPTMIRVRARGEGHVPLRHDGAEVRGRLAGRAPNGAPEAMTVDNRDHYYTPSIQAGDLELVEEQP